jgi:hypothetical protein
MAREDLFTPVHKGIRSMIYDTGSLLQTTDFADKDATGKACARLEKELRTASKSCVLCFLSNHADDENNYIFSVMNSHVPEIVSTLLKEHEEIEREMDSISQLSGDIQNTTDKQYRIAKGIDLNRRLNELFAYYITHMNKEEVTILPATQKYLTDVQLSSIRSKITMSLPPDRAPMLIGWIVKSLNINESLDLMKGMKSTMPAPAYENILRLVQSSLDSVEWQKLKAGLET